jgi:hypothetical protein
VGGGLTSKFCKALAAAWWKGQSLSVEAARTRLSKPSADRLRRRHASCGLLPTQQCTRTAGAGDCWTVCEERSDDGGEREEVAFSSH